MSLVTTGMFGGEARWDCTDWDWDSVCDWMGCSLVHSFLICWERPRAGGTTQLCHHHRRPRWASDLDFCRCDRTVIPKRAVWGLTAQLGGGGIVSFSVRLPPRGHDLCAGFTQAFVHDI